MANYRKKPVVIEARLYDQTDFEVVHWAGGQANAEGFVIPTLEGEMQARKGDYIIKGVQGEFYPCRADIFQRTYEEV